MKFDYSYYMIDKYLNLKADNNCTIMMSEEIYDNNDKIRGEDYTIKDNISNEYFHLYFSYEDNHIYNHCDEINGNIIFKSENDCISIDEDAFDNDKEVLDKISEFKNKWINKITEYNKLVEESQLELE